MTQEIITYGIILAAVTYAVYSIVKSLKPSPQKSGCGGCTGCDIGKNKSCTIS